MRLHVVIRGTESGCWLCEWFLGPFNRIHASFGYIHTCVVSGTTVNELIDGTIVQTKG